MPLKLSIEWLHAPGVFEATLENGARFIFRREDVSGKLENNLTLYRQAVASLIEGKPLREASTDKSRERKALMALSAGKSVEVIGVRANRREGPLSLDDLEIDF